MRLFGLRFNHGVGLAGVVATWFAGGPAPRDPLATPQRQAMLHLVRACPGLTVRALQARLSYQWSSFYLHLGRLVEAGLVKVEPDSRDARVRRIYPVVEGVSRFPEPPRPVVLKGLSLDVARLVSAQPGLGFAEVANLLETPARNVHYHLKRLVALGLVTSSSTTRYRDLQPTKALLDILATIPATPSGAASPVDAEDEAPEVGIESSPRTDG